MKKKIAVLISFMMVLTLALAACGGGGGNDDVSGSKYVGTWKADSASFAGESGALDTDFTLTLNDDGTMTFNDDQNNEAFHQAEIETSKEEW